MEGVRLADAGDLVLDAIGQAVVEGVAESAIAVVAYLRSVAVELNHVLRDSVGVGHEQIVQAMLSVTDGVVRAEVGPQLVDELVVIVHPTRAEAGICAQEEFGLEPIERHALEEGLGIYDLRLVRVERPWSVLEVELTLHKECAELQGVGSVELVGLAEFGTSLWLGRRTWGIGSVREGSDVGKRLRELLE